jgi:hypothetical protein
VRAKHEKKEGGIEDMKGKQRPSVSEKRMATKEDISDHRTAASYNR